MADQHSFRDLAHWAMHRIPGVPAHVEHPAGHQGTTHHAHAWRHHPVAHHGSRHDRRNHAPARPPQMLITWQRRIAAFFGQEL